MGVVAFAASYFLLEDPPYLKAERAELRKKPLHFDTLGLIFFGHRHDLLGSAAEQRTAVGLVERPLPARADADGTVLSLTGGLDLLGAAHGQPRGGPSPLG